MCLCSTCLHLPRGFVIFCNYPVSVSSNASRTTAKIGAKRERKLQDKLWSQVVCVSTGSKCLNSFDDTSARLCVYIYPRLCYPVRSRVVNHARTHRQTGHHSCYHPRMRSIDFLCLIKQVLSFFCNRYYIDRDRRRVNRAPSIPPPYKSISISSRRAWVTTWSTTIIYPLLLVTPPPSRYVGQQTRMCAGSYSTCAQERERKKKRLRI